MKKNICNFRIPLEIDFYWENDGKQGNYFFATNKKDQKGLLKVRYIQDGPPQL